MEDQGEEEQRQLDRRLALKDKWIMSTIPDYFTKKMSDWYDDGEDWFVEESDGCLDLPGVCESAWYKEEGEGDLSKTMDTILAEYQEQLGREERNIKEQ